MHAAGGSRGLQISQPNFSFSSLVINFHSVQLLVKATNVSVVYHFHMNVPRMFEGA